MNAESLKKLAEENEKNAQAEFEKLLVKYAVQPEWIEQYSNGVLVQRGLMFRFNPQMALQQK